MRKKMMIKFTIKVKATDFIWIFIKHLAIRHGRLTGRRALHPDLSSDLGFGKVDVYFLKKGSWSSQVLLFRLEM